MCLFLKQSTAAVVSFGPFLDKTDGVTPETGLVSSLDHGTTGILLSKNGGTLTIRHATVTATTYDSYGNYKVTLDTTDTNTLGTLRMQFIETATCLPVWQDFMVLPANIFDSLVSGSDLVDVSVVQLNGGAQSLTDLKDFADTGYDPSTHIAAADIQTIKTQTVTCSGGVTVPAATLASTTNITAGTITTVTNLTNAPTNGDLTATMKTSVTTACTASTPTAAAVTGAVGSVAAISAGAITASSFAAGAIDAAAIATDAFGALELAAGAATEIATAVWTTTIETGVNATQQLQLIGAATAGPCSGGPGSPVFKGTDGTTTRITGTADSDGNRTAATYNV